MTQTFVQGFVAGGTGLDYFLPVVIFIIAGLLSFSTGTAWGTFGILIPIAVPVAISVDPSLTVVCLSATLAGILFSATTAHRFPIQLFCQVRAADVRICLT